MKTLFFSLCIFALLSPSYELSAQKPAAGKGIDTVKIVNAIKLEYGAIDAKRKTYSQYDAEFTGNASEGALFTGSYSGTVLKMITCVYYNDKGKTEADCYVNGSGVFFMYAKEYEYISPLSVDRSGKTKSITENWYYFNKEEMIKWVAAGKVKPAGSEEFINKKNYFREEFKKYKKLFSNMATLRKVK